MVDFRPKGALTVADDTQHAQFHAAGFPHMMVEIGERVSPWRDVLGSAGTFAIAPISAVRAFREYNWIAGAPVLNSAGNLRGMVISKTARTVWNISSKGGDWVGLAGIVIELAKEIDRMQRVWSSPNLSVNDKGPMLLCLGSAAILRGVASVVPTAVHLAALSASGYLDVAGAVSGSNKPLALADQLQKGDQWVTSTFNAQWDGANWYTFISQHLVF